MPCIFCLAVFAVFAGALTTVVLDQMEARIASVATEPVVRSVDSASVAKFETAVTIPGRHGLGTRSVPVSITVYKKHKRVRIQVMTHDLTRAEAEAVEDLIAAALELRIVDRSDAHDEAKVREAFGEAAASEAISRSEAELQPEAETESEVDANSASEAESEAEPEVKRKSESGQRITNPPR
jgi:hypothetical protein